MLPQLPPTFPRRGGMFGVRVSRPLETWLGTRRLGLRGPPGSQKVKVKREELQPEWVSGV